MSDELDSDNFDLKLYLSLLCKKHHTYYEDQKGKLEIDFIALQKKLVDAQGVQQRTCEQIVQFVDQNRQSFLGINAQLEKIESKVSKSENILKLLGNRIDEYKSEYYLTESKIQRFINEYQLRLIRTQVMKLARSEATFLFKLNNQFQIITNRGIMELNMTQKYLISRFTYKLQYIKGLYNHHIIKEHMPQSLQIGEIVTNLVDQFQFYLGEQLSKYQAIALRTTAQTQLQHISEVLQQIRNWYLNLNKQEQYYKIIERNSIQKEMQAGQKILLSNKTSLLSGKDPHIIQSVMVKIFSSVVTFPESHPKERLKGLLFSFFKKDQLKFLYTYAMPIFPLAYRSYFAALEKVSLPEWVRGELRERHGWNLKMWMQVRQKNISDRSSNDSDILKWIDIIFKGACLLPGTLSEFTKLVFKIINRFLSKVVTQDFLASSFSKLVDQSRTVGPALKEKILGMDGRAEQTAERVKRSVDREYEKAMDNILSKNLQNIAHSCQGSLQSAKSFVTKIIKKDKQFMQRSTVNKRQSLFKPLQGFSKNNAELSQNATNIIAHFVERSVVKYYDSHYAPQILAYSKDHLIYEQTSLVMEVVGRERTTLFQTVKDL